MIDCRLFCLVFAFFFSSVLSRTLYISNVAAHVIGEDVERLVVPLGALQKCEKLHGRAADPNAPPSTSSSSTQTFEVVYETSDEAEKSVASFIPSFPRSHRFSSEYLSSIFRVSFEYLSSIFRVSFEKRVSFELFLNIFRVSFGYLRVSFANQVLFRYLSGIFRAASL